MWPWRIYLFCTAPALAAMQAAAEAIMPNGAVERLMFGRLRLDGGATYACNTLCTTPQKDAWIAAVAGIDDPALARYYVVDNDGPDTVLYRASNSAYFAESQVGAAKSFDAAHTDYIRPVHTALIAAPDGTAQGAGTLKSPMDLATALAQIAPGGMVQLRGGKYRGVFGVSTAWNTGEYLTIRAYQGEHVEIDGGLVLNTDWVDVRGLEMYDSNPDRVSARAGSDPADLTRKAGISSSAARHIRLINNIIHDGGNGILARGDGPWEIYGNVVYHNGWTGTDGRHGHGLYTNAGAGRETFAVRHNIMLNPFAYNLHAFSQWATDQIAHYAVIANALVQRNNIAAGTAAAGGAHDVTFEDNLLYNSDVHFGYAVNNVGLSVRRNTFAGAAFWTYLDCQDWSGALVSDNVFYAANGSPFARIDNDFAGAWDGNLYYEGGRGNRYYRNADYFTFAAWQRLGFDAAGREVAGAPADAAVLIPNEYDANRALLAVYNFSEAAAVTVDVSAWADEGATVRVHNPLAFWTDLTELTVTGGTIVVPMTGWTNPPPLGLEAALYPSTLPAFGVFVLTQ